MDNGCSRGVQAHIGSGLRNKNGGELELSALPTICMATTAAFLLVHALNPVVAFSLPSPPLQGAPAPGASQMTGAPSAGQPTQTGISGGVGGTQVGQAAKQRMHKSGGVHTCALSCVASPQAHRPSAWFSVLTGCLLCR
jgi:hypothetical protein